MSCCIDIESVTRSSVDFEEQKERVGQLAEIVLAASQVAKSINEQLVRLATAMEWRWCLAIVRRNW